ncbi:hypothetical protein LINGRAHAP2_LOCUS28354 [Linum grandiflorum]
MEGERKRSSKGKFFNMFDWNGKSRKKLFPNNSELLLEGPKTWKENVERGSNSNSELYKMEVDDRRGNVSSTKGSSDFSCASSITSDDGYGTRPASVVARLMGLDSMPMSNVVELDTSLGRNGNPPLRYDSNGSNLWCEYDPMDVLNVSSRMEMERNHWSSRESRQHVTMQGRPIERFKTETLPPRSAKSIPSTHHKLLSPIKTPGFTSTRNVAYIAEAAAKIMESSPRATATAKVPSIGSPSVPMRIRDLKQKMEAAASRPRSSSSESFTSRNLNGQRRVKSNSGSEGTSSSRRPVISGKVSPESVREKGKSVSRPIQARTSVQRPDGLQARSNSVIKQKERIKSSQAGAQKSVQKKPAEIRNNVLRQNHQKQNNLSKKDGSSSTVKQSVPNQTSSGSSSSSRVVRKTLTGSVNSEKEKRKTPIQKKQLVKVDPQSGSGSSTSDKRSYNNKDSRSIKCSIAPDECMNTSTSNGKNNGMDVVSFTFTSPMGRDMSKSPTSSQAMRVTNGFPVDDGNNTHFRHAISLPGIGSDDLGVLLEQKLRELTDKVESSRCNVIREDNCASPVTSSLKSSEESHQTNGECFSGELSLQNSNHEHQQSEEIGDHSCSSSYSERGDELGSEHPSTMWIPNQSCSDTRGSSDQWSPNRVSNSVSANVTGDEQLETELSDSATSSAVNRLQTIGPFTTTNKYRDSSNWELDYVSDMLESAEMRLEDLALGISPRLFYDEENKLASNDRKVLFDCIVEFLDSKCRRNSVETCKAWSELRVLFGTKGWLAKELQKQITGWKSMGDLMVDELVDIDMSCSRHGRWLDFDLEAFEEGVEIEEEILASLVDDLVSDFLVL